LRYEGHLWLQRDVLPGAAVHAQGDVEVGGKVIGARIVAFGGVRIAAGANRSLMIAGGPGWVYGEALPLVREVGERLRQLRQGPQPTEGVGAAFRALAALIGRLAPILGGAEAPLDPTVQHLAGLLGQLARLFGDRDEDAAARLAVADAVGPAVVELLAQVEQEMTDRLSHPGGCVLRYLDGTRLQATGDVEILTPGAWRSDVATLGRARVVGGFRGGSLRALGGAHLGTVGSENAVPTRVEVGPEASLEADDVYPGTTLVRGATVRVFRERAHRVVLGGTP